MSGNDKKYSKHIGYLTVDHLQQSANHSSRLVTAPFGVVQWKRPGNGGAEAEHSSEIIKLDSVIIFYIYASLHLRQKRM